MPRVSLDDMRVFFANEFPQADVVVEALGERTSRIRQDVHGKHLRPGGTVSGPVMMAMADTGAYAALLGEIGIVPLAVTSNLSIAFFKKPDPGRTLFADSKLLKVGRRLAVAEVLITAEGDSEPLAHATVTYAIPGSADRPDLAAKAKAPGA